MAPCSPWVSARCRTKVVVRCRPLKASNPLPIARPMAVATIPASTSRPLQGTVRVCPAVNLPSGTIPTVEMEAAAAVTAAMALLPVADTAARQAAANIAALKAVEDMADLQAAAESTADLRAAVEATPARLPIPDTADPEVTARLREATEADRLVGDTGAAMGTISRREATVGTEARRLRNRATEVGAQGIREMNLPVAQAAGTTVGGDPLLLLRGAIKAAEVVEDTRREAIENLRLLRYRSSNAKM